MTCRQRGLPFAVGLIALACAAPPAEAQVKYPERPEKYDIQVRYRIRAERDERVRQFRAMEANLKRLGFVPSDREDADLDVVDPTAERFSGTIPSKTAFQVLDDPRVRTILVAPAGFKYPDVPEAPLAIRVGLVGGFLAADQQRLHRQAVAQLQRLGFREAVGYDHRGYTVVRGTFPNGNLFRLLKDLRREPAGWFVADTPPEQLAPPIRDILPVRYVEILTEADAPPFSPQFPGANRARFTPDLAALLDDEKARANPARIEVVMEQTLTEQQIDLLRTRLRAEYSVVSVNPTSKQPEADFATVEGWIGSVATIRFVRAADVERFMFEPGVVVARLPRAGYETVVRLPGLKGTPGRDALKISRLGAFHDLGYDGRGTRVVIIASEFAGIEELLGKELPGDTRVLDLTAELSAALLPAKPDPARVGAGLAAARAAHLAAPGASLVLVRIDPTAFFQALSVARLARGDREYTDALQARITELSFKADDLRRHYADAVEEYREAFANPSDEERPRQRRARAKEVLEGLIARQKELTTLLERATALQRNSRSLEGAQVIVNTLEWEHGYPLDGLSAVSREIDETLAGEAFANPRTPSATRPRFSPRPLWVQAGGMAVGSVWGGPYLDADANGVMEFAPPNAPLPVGDWTRELNFLATLGADGKPVAALPNGVRLRLTVQWREPHNPEVYGGRDSIFPLTLRVFRQLDPAGEKRASDELEEVARSVAGPYRVRKEPTYGVYEQIVEFVVPADGRYAVRIDGRPAFDPILPALRQQIELTPRLFAEFVGTTPDKGRPVFASYFTRNTGVGMPGDAKASVVVGATNRPDGTEVIGMTGGGPGLTLLQKPDLLADGTLEVGDGLGGSGLAAGFAGGAAAALIGSGAPASDLLRATGLKRGGPVIISEGWLRAVPPRPRSPGR